MDKAVNCGVMRPGFKSRWGREVFRFARSVSVCVMSFGLREVFQICENWWIEELRCSSFGVIRE